MSKWGGKPPTAAAAAARCNVYLWLCEGDIVWHKSTTLSFFFVQHVAHLILSNLRHPDNFLRFEPIYNGCYGYQRCMGG